MDNFNNLMIVGSSHIAKQSIREVKKMFDEQKPDIVALELDSGRLTALMSKGKRASKFSILKSFGFTAFIFALLGEFAQKQLGKIVGITPGAEMLAAINLSKKNKSKVVLIDQNIEITLKRLSREFTNKERGRFLWDITFGLLFPKRIDFDLNKVPSDEIVDRLIRQVQERYPSLYKVLIEERNRVMAHNLLHLIYLNPDKKILAVVGAGHVNGIRRLLETNYQTISYSFG